MHFKNLALTFEQIHQTSFRLEITQLLADLFNKVTAREAQIISYLCLGVLRPSYYGTQFSLAEKSIKKLSAHLLGLTAAEVTALVKTEGDLGRVITAHLAGPADHHLLSIIQVHDALSDLEKITGKGAQEERAHAFEALLKKLDPLSAGTVVRIVLGNLRLGFSDMTIIDALSWMLVGNKSLHERIEHAYNLCADLGYIASVLKEDGIEGLEKVHVTLGVPIRPAAAERLSSTREIIEKLGPSVAQHKLDGFRLQVHVRHSGDDVQMWFFSRNLQNMSEMFPDLVKEFKKIKADSFIVEGEAIVFDEQTGSFVPFQETVKRKRKHDIEEVAAQLPLRFYVFDILYLNGHSVMDKAHHTRRELILKLFNATDENAVIQPINEQPVETAQQLEHYFLHAFDAGLEGVVVKRPNAHYQPGKRNFNWIKLKRHEEGELQDTIDVVILGYYAGKGKRSSFGIGAFLVGVYNKKDDRYETIAKVGTGLTDQEWHELKQRCDKYAVPEKPLSVVCAKELTPDVWVTPRMVCVVRADEITLSPIHTAGKTHNHLGFALRFPRIMGYRDDKNAEQATTIKEIKELYEMSLRK